MEKVLYFSDESEKGNHYSYQAGKLLVMGGDRSFCKICKRLKPRVEIETR